MPGIDISKHPIHLGRGAQASVEPEFTGSMQWYADYVARHSDDGAEARLVSLHRFSESWSVWEMHPHGAEVVLCLSGHMTLHQEGQDGTVQRVDLGPGEYAINAAGTWHTADAQAEVSALFITAGVGTEHRPRDSAAAP
ncbi:cupin domain-containing protein [Algiphilus sp. NNCM1]|uniref:cupin domain-containing protein n=1 Tax=Algiphilus sp. TaxID=1872431 RepID=UPI001CA6FFF0|nr:cupin domain-containing protein [Algiphilus sp.]MBY8965217.1 cupin domain-containing protein [Algiphilus acroporae]MCI5104808.1 cupin domain-containing protein [Algiphilus sp.]